MGALYLTPAIVNDEGHGLNTNAHLNLVRSGETNSRRVPWASPTGSTQTSTEHDWRKSSVDSMQLRTSPAAASLDCTPSGATPCEMTASSETRSNVAHRVTKRERLNTTSATTRMTGMRAASSTVACPRVDQHVRVA